MTPGAVQFWGSDTRACGALKRFKPTAVAAVRRVPAGVVPLRLTGEGQCRLLSSDVFTNAKLILRT